MVRTVGLIMTLYGKRITNARELLRIFTTFRHLGQKIFFFDEPVSAGYIPKKVITRYTKAAMIILTGMAITMATNKLIATPQRTAESRLVIPTPMIEPAMVK